MGGFANSQQAYTENTGLNTTNSAWVDQRDPTQFDVNYVIGQFWQNQANLTLWYLNRKSNASGQLLGTWEQIAAVTSFQSLSDTANTIVYPSTLADVPPENIQLVGGTGISVVATPASHLLTISLAGGGAAEGFAMQTGTSPVVPDGSNIVTFNGAVVAAGINPVRTDGTGANTMTLEVQISQAIAGTDATKIGLSAFDSSKFGVDANGFVTLLGSAPIEGVIVDAHTAPGTSPVVPDVSGNITVTGGQVAAGTTSNVIRTDSLAANTYTIEIQRSQAVASSTVGDNGVCHFNSADFTVDANGFVSIANFSPFVYKAITVADSPYTVLATDYYISCDSSGGAITIRLPNAPTTYRQFIIKDRVGSASTNNISITTVGGAVTIDGSTTYLLAGNWASVQLLFNSTSYEVF